MLTEATGPIEKGVNDGQTQYCKDLFVALKAAVSSRPRAGTGGTMGTPKGRKKIKKGKATNPSGESQGSNVNTQRVSKQSWGLLEPIRGVAEPVVDILKPIFTGNIMYGILVGLLVATWFGFGLKPGRNASTFAPDGGGRWSPDRIAAYEEMWRREDTELWEWLDERVGLDRLRLDRAVTGRKKAAEPQSVEQRLKEERMGDKEVEEAIRVTEEKLKVLREVMDRRAFHTGTP